MTGLLDLIDDVMAQDAGANSVPDRSVGSAVGRDCDGCDEYKPDVDLFAENSETGEELWLCLACGDW